MKNLKLRVCSFNIRYDNILDFGVRSWKCRRNIVVGLLKYHNMDLIGFQEVLKNQLEYLSDYLDEYDYVGVGREDGIDKGEFVPIFYKKDKFILEKWGTFWLSDTPEVKGSIGWDAACVRITTWAKFTLKDVNNSLLFFNTHFDHFGHKAMLSSAYLLLEKVKNIAKDVPVIIVGDFNNTEDSLVYKILTEKAEKDLRITDSKYVSLNGHYGCSFSFHDFNAAKMIYKLSNSKRNKDKKMKYLIDYIFIKNNIKVINHGILPDNCDGIFPSDHMPVICDLEILSNSPD